MRFVRALQPESLLTLLVTDGTTMAAVQGGKELHWSTHKQRCGDRDTCPSLAPECEAPTHTGFVNHWIVSSEPLQGENVWVPLEPGELEWDRDREVLPALTTRGRPHQLEHLQGVV